jgi:transposase
MELNEKQYRRIAGLLPVQRGNVKIENRALLNALIYRCENGGKWRALPRTFGKWHSIYVRLNRRAEKGVLEQVYAALVQEGLLNAGAVYCLDSAAAKAHPGAQEIGKTRGGWNTKIHAAACGDTLVKGFLLSGGNVQDAEAGRLLLETLGKQESTRSLLMDRAYADYRTRLFRRKRI